MPNIAAIAQSSPGAMAVNRSILVGWRLMGLPGALVAIVTIFSTVLPPFIILSVLLLLYAAFRGNAVVNAMLKSMMAGVCAVIFDVVIAMGVNSVKTKK